MKIRLLLLSILLISSPHAAAMFEQLIQIGVNAVARGIQKGIQEAADGKAADGKAGNGGEITSKGEPQEGVNAVGKKASKGISDIGKTDLEKGMASRREGDNKTALEYLLPLAEQGDPLGQFELAVVYTLQNDDPAAFKWFKLSADQGVSDAQYNLGVMYSNGSSVPKDQKAAFKLFTLAADQFHLGAMEQLGWEYAFGDEVKKDDISAYMWSFIAESFGQKDSSSNTLVTLKARMSPRQIEKALYLAQKCLGVKANWFKECGMDPTEAAKFKKQSVGLEKAKKKDLDLKKLYEAYFLVRACNDLDTKYISNSQLKKTKKAIRSLDDQAKKQGVDTDKVYKDAETNPSDSTNRTLAGVKTIKLLGAQNNYNQQLRTSCIGQSNLLILLAEGDKAEKQKGKKDF